MQCSQCRRMLDKRVKGSTLALQAGLTQPAYAYSAILANTDNHVENARKRKVNFTKTHMQQVYALHKKRKELATALSEVKRKQNNIGKVGAAAFASKSDTKAQEAAKLAGVSLRNRVKQLTTEWHSVDGELLSLVNRLPNSTHPDVPVGDYDQCRVVRTSGPAPLTSDSFNDHVRVMEILQWIDFAAGSTTTGSRWPFLLNEAAILETALINYALSHLLSAGFQMMIPPDIVKLELANRCGFKPRDDEASQNYHIVTSEEENLVLAGTAEIPLAGYFHEKTFEEKELPQMKMALGRAFRAEAGSRGKESKGLYRVHQFSKVEMFAVCKQGEGDAMLERLVQVQEAILAPLGFSLRTLDMSTEELGASAFRKYDIEAWMPGRGNWGELASASLCTDYQSRRLAIRYRPIIKKPASPIKDDIPIPPHLEATANLDYSEDRQPKTLIAHTLNATAAAIPRLIVALVENGVKMDGRSKELYVELPSCLKEYWLGPKDEEGVLSSALGRRVIRWK